jgi:hypothetical protein
MNKRGAVMQDRSGTVRDAPTAELLAILYALSRARPWEAVEYTVCYLFDNVLGREE